MRCDRSSCAPSLDSVRAFKLFNIETRKWKQEFWFECLCKTYLRTGGTPHFLGLGYRAQWLYPSLFWMVERKFATLLSDNLSYSCTETQYWVNESCVFNLFVWAKIWWQPSTSQSIWNKNITMYRVIRIHIIASSLHSLRGLFYVCLTISVQLYWSHFSYYLWTKKCH